MPVVDVFKALGDPIRLEIVQRLSAGTTYTLASVSSELGITRQGARKHVDVLVKAHLVTLKAQGREVSVHLEKDSLEKAKAFIAELEKRWDKRLLVLKEFVEK